jgi:hypothetical protein
METVTGLCEQRNEYLGSIMFGVFLINMLVSQDGLDSKELVTACGRERSKPNEIRCPEICLDTLGITTMDLSLVNRFAGRYLNPRHPDYQARR